MKICKICWYAVMYRDKHWTCVNPESPYHKCDVGRPYPFSRTMKTFIGKELPIFWKTCRQYKEEKK